MTVGSVLQIEKEAVICDCGSRDLDEVTLNSSKIVFYESPFPSCIFDFKIQTILKTTTLLEKYILRMTHYD